MSASAGTTRILGSRPARTSMTVVATVVAAVSLSLLLAACKGLGSQDGEDEESESEPRASAAATGLAFPMPRDAELSCASFEALDAVPPELTSKRVAAARVLFPSPLPGDVVAWHHDGQHIYADLAEPAGTWKRVSPGLWQPAPDTPRAQVTGNPVEAGYEWRLEPDGVWRRPWDPPTTDETGDTTSTVPVPDPGAANRDTPSASESEMPPRAEAPAALDAPLRPEARLGGDAAARAQAEQPPGPATQSGSVLAREGWRRVASLGGIRAPGALIPLEDGRMCVVGAIVGCFDAQARAPALREIDAELPRLEDARRAIRITEDVADTQLEPGAWLVGGVDGFLALASADLESWQVLRTGFVGDLAVAGTAADGLSTLAATSHGVLALDHAAPDVDADTSDDADEDNEGETDDTADDDAHDADGADRSAPNASAQRGHAGSGAEPELPSGWSALDTTWIYPEPWRVAAFDAQHAEAWVAGDVGRIARVDLSDLHELGDLHDARSGRVVRVPTASRDTWRAIAIGEARVVLAGDHLRVLFADRVIDDEKGETESDDESGASDEEDDAGTAPGGWTPAYRLTNVVLPRRGALGDDDAVTSIAIAPGEDEHVWLAAGGQLLISRDDGESFCNESDALPWRWNASIDDVVVLSASHALVRSTKGELALTEDGGASFELVSGDVEVTGPVLPLSSTTVLAGTASGLATIDLETGAATVHARVAALETSSRAGDQVVFGGRGGRLVLVELE